MFFYYLLALTFIWIGLSQNYAAPTQDGYTQDTLTALSMPSVSSMMKKTMAQKVEPGSVEMASG